MRRILSQALVVLAIASMAAWGADNSIGTWKVNIEKSKYAPGPIPVKTRTSGREVVPRGVKATNSGERTRPEAWWAVLMRQRCVAEHLVVQSYAATDQST